MFEKLFDYVNEINRQNKKDSEVVRISELSGVPTSTVKEFLDIYW